MSEITPVRVEVPDAALDDLRARLRATRWPEPETVDDWSQGAPLAYVQDVCRYWADGYDWRAFEAQLNGFAHFRTQIDGLGIHFLHVRSREADAIPVIMTHGWPGSIVEFVKVIGPLTDPVAHGGRASDALHVVCPSLPGYGFSDKPARAGWGIDRIADAWATLMARLGYDRYGAQGGDWGAIVTTALGGRDPEHCLGIHLNMPLAFPTAEDLQDLTPRDEHALARAKHYDVHDSGYAKQQSTRPQTIGYGLVDSPAAQAAWILDKFWSWTDADGHPENVLTRDELLNNVMLYWLPATGASSARLYWETAQRWERRPVTIPSGMSIFPKEIFQPPRRWAEREYTDIRHWHELDKGGHFAAFEQPETFVDEVRAFFRLMR